MEFIIKMNAQEVVKAEEKGLISAIAAIEESQQGKAIESVSPPVCAPVQQVPVATPQPEPSMPVMPAVAPTTVPVEQTTYSQNDLALAASQLMDAGKQQELIALLSRFNVPSLVDLQPDQYGAFAAELRNMGAKI